VIRETKRLLQHYPGQSGHRGRSVRCRRLLMIEWTKYHQSPGPTSLHVLGIGHRASPKVGAKKLLPNWLATKSRQGRDRTSPPLIRNDGDPNQRIQAVPAAGTEVPSWILGSSNFGAMLAAELGLPYAFASHFAPELLIPALQIYRSSFKPSEQLDCPYTMVGINIIAPPAAMTKRVGCRRRSRCPLRTSSAARAALASRGTRCMDASAMDVRQRRHSVPCRTRR
jgi:hypothetical protein